MIRMGKILKPCHLASVFIVTWFQNQQSDTLPKNTNIYRWKNNVMSRFYCILYQSVINRIFPTNININIILYLWILRPVLVKVLMNVFKYVLQNPTPQQIITNIMLNKNICKNKY